VHFALRLHSFFFAEAECHRPAVRREMVQAMCPAAHTPTVHLAVPTVDLGVDTTYNGLTGTDVTHDASCVALAGPLIENRFSEQGLIAA